MMKQRPVFEAMRSAVGEATSLVPWLFLVLAMLGRFDATEHPRAVALVAATWLLAVCSFVMGKCAARWWRTRRPNGPNPPSV